MHSKEWCGFLFLSKTMNGNAWGSQIKLLYTKVQLNSEGALLFQPVEAYWLRCAQPPMHEKDGYSSSLVLYPPSVGLSWFRYDISFFLSRVQLASELCLSSDRYSFICTVLSLGWCNDFKKTIKDIWNESLGALLFVLMCFSSSLFYGYEPVITLSHFNTLIFSCPS